MVIKINLFFSDFDDNTFRNFIVMNDGLWRVNFRLIVWPREIREYIRTGLTLWMGQSRWLCMFRKDSARSANGPGIDEVSTPDHPRKGNLRANQQQHFTPPWNCFFYTVQSIIKTSFIAGLLSYNFTSALQTESGWGKRKLKY